MLNLNAIIRNVISKVFLMLETYKNTKPVILLLSGIRKIALLLVLSFVLSACGGLADVSGTRANSTISWAPMTVNGDNAEEYRVLYSRSGERPKEVITTTPQADITASSLNGYTIYIEAFNNDGDSVFILYNPS